MEVEIRIHRPLVLLAVVAGVVWAVAAFTGASRASVQALPAGEGGVDAAAQEEDIRLLREEQRVLEKREDILRAQLAALQEERLAAGGEPTLEAEIADTTDALVALLQDRSASEARLLASLRDLWEAQGAARKGSRAGGTAPTALRWPVPPVHGISAGFRDTGYQARFGMRHDAVDIPVEQGTVVHAAADGVVQSAADRGMGFNALVIEHDGGVATLYGHVSSFLVREGDRVRAGDAVALSGGRPGTPGAGMFTTGPHLHFEVHRDGAPVNPMDYLHADELP